MLAGACAERSRSKRATPSRHPDAKRKGPVKSCITKKRLVLFARDACCWSVDVLFFLIIS